MRFESIILALYEYYKSEHYAKEAILKRLDKLHNMNSTLLKAAFQELEDEQKRNAAYDEICAYRIMPYHFDSAEKVQIIDMLVDSRDYDFTVPFKKACEIAEIRPEMYRTIKARAIGKRFCIFNSVRSGDVSHRKIHEECGLTEYELLQCISDFYMMLGESMYEFRYRMLYNKMVEHKLSEAEIINLLAGKTPGQLDEMLEQYIEENADRRQV